MKQTHINDLPNEIMMKIFLLLTPLELRTTMLVSKLWMVIAGDPTLWTWSVLMINDMNDLKKLKNPRLQLRMKNIKVSECDHYGIWYRQHECQWKPKNLAALFRALLLIPSLTRIHYDELFAFFGYVEPKLLTSVLSRLEELKLLGEMHITSEQAEHFLIAIDKKGTNLKKLELWNLPENDISPALYGSSLSNIKELMLSGQYENPKQLHAFFATIAEEVRPLKKLSLSSCDIHNLEPVILGKALNRLEEVIIENIWILPEQITAILKDMLKNESKLKILMMKDLTFESLGGVGPDLIKQAKAKIGEFYTKSKFYGGPINVGF